MIMKNFWKYLFQNIEYFKDMIQEMTTVLECENCGHKFPSKEVELTNADITDEYSLELSGIQ